MTANKIIHVRATGSAGQFREAKAGYVSHLVITGLQYPAELRQNPPRIKLLEDNIIGKYMPCELLDEWPDAPGSWPVDPVVAPKLPKPAPLATPPSELSNTSRPVLPYPMPPRVPLDAPTPASPP